MTQCDLEDFLPNEKRISIYKNGTDDIVIRDKVYRKYSNIMESGDWSEVVDDILDAYREWRDFDMLLTLLYREDRESEDVDEIHLIKASKRGNDVYAEKMDNKVTDLIGELGEICDLASEKETNVVKVDLTLDSSRFPSLHHAWKNDNLDSDISDISDEFNKWITSLRNEYGSVSYICVPEAHRDKRNDVDVDSDLSDRNDFFPHFHVLLIFEDTKFKQNLDGSLRGEIERDFKDRWATGLDHQVNVMGVRNVIKRILYMTQHLTTKPSEFHSKQEKRQAEVTLALTWYFNKDCLNTSRDIQEALSQLDTKHIDEDSKEEGESEDESEGRWIEFGGTFSKRRLKVMLGIDRWENYMVLTGEKKDRFMSIYEMFEDIAYYQYRRERTDYSYQY